MGILAFSTVKVLAAGSAAELMEHVLPYYWTREADGSPAPFSFSNHILMMLIAALLVLLVFTYVGAKARTNLVPRGMHNFFESILSFLRTELIRPALGANADRFTPFIWSVFFFILFCNLLGMVPVNEIMNVIKGTGHKPGEVFHPSHFWGTATANFSVTGGLAIVAFITVHISGVIQQIRIKMDPTLDPHYGHGHSEHGHGAGGGHGSGEAALAMADSHGHGHMVHASKVAGQPLPLAVITGFGAYIWNFAPHPEAGGKIMDFGLYLLLLVLEAIGALVKPFSLCIRLFANMVAGHLVLGALVGMVPIGLGVAWWATGSVALIVIAGCIALSLLELFVAFLQAYIFTFLTTLFIASAVAPEH